MNAQEQRLIEDLFDRLRQQGPMTKDRQADTLITQRLRESPDAAYMLVQSAIVFQHQIAANEERIRELESQAGEDDNGGGSFLGGLLGGGRDRDRDTQRRPMADAAPPRTASPWGRGSAGRGAVGGEPATAVPQAGSRGGGFLSTALSTATGVAGGMMVAESLRGMFGGSAQARGSEGGGSGSDQAALKDADKTQDELQDEQDARNESDDQAQDANDDYDSSGGDDSMDV